MADIGTALRQISNMAENVDGFTSTAKLAHNILTEVAGSLSNLGVSDRASMAYMAAEKINAAISAAASVKEQLEESLSLAKAAAGEGGGIF
ncbi:hypothetical protein [Longispora albida]|uniref:hypothetical protein n=1 Tax=Longispora albida TaxID=203523 RepID=UPI00037A8360|nr:hypothetical protein [Longispora albida]